jgi:putative DNA primase/helicase
MTVAHKEVAAEWLAVWRVAYEQWRQDIKEWENDKQGKPPEKPLAKRLVLGDTTPEKLHEILSENPAGILVLRDELSGWLAEMEKKGRETQREIFLTAWNGNAQHTMDRIMRGTVTAVMCASMFGNYQPDLLLAYMANGDRHDGLLQRHQLFVWPEFKPWENVDRTPNYGAMKRVEKVIRFLVALPEEGLFFHFKPDAQLLFNAWLKDHQQRVDAERFPPKQSHLSKYRGLLPRLAALFQLADMADGSHQECGLHGERAIDEEHTQQAIGLCRYLASHLDKIYGSVVTAAQQATKDLAKHIQDGDLNKEDEDAGFSLRDVYKKCWRGLCTEEDVRVAIEGLEEAYWVRRAPEKKASSGGRPTQRWHINPAVWQGHIHA